MSVYSELVNELGFDPMAPAPEIPYWEPWTIQGALAEVTGSWEEYTAWTRKDAQVLVRDLSPNGGEDD